MLIPYGLEESAGWRAKKAENARKAGEKGHEVPPGAENVSEKNESGGREARDEAVANPSKAAKVAGIPKSLIVT